MTEWLLPASFLLGLAGSGHCAAMCGPIVVVLEGLPRAQRQSLLMRRFSYQAGRGLFYMALGALAASGGVLLGHLVALPEVANTFRIAALVVTLVIATKLIFNWSLPVQSRLSERLWEWVRPVTTHLLPMDNAGKALLMGALWGAIPCGMVYAAAALAITSGSPAGGAATMLAFWAGTAPALWLAGSFSQVLSQRRRSFGFALAILAFTGMFTLVPGLQHSDLDASAPASHHHH